MSNTNAPWPVPYLPANDKTGSPSNCNWDRSEVLVAGAALVQAFLDPATGPAHGREYRTVVDLASDGSERVYDYEPLIRAVYTSAKPFNSNDFANVHHVAWLYVLEALACLLNGNLHGDWGDPPPMGTLHHELEKLAPRWFHNVPNATGYYAVSTLDLPPPDTGV